jgi:3-oxoacyl-[acyl-carrier protein] reductase
VAQKEETVDLQLKGKAALVAAGTRGIGKAVAMGLAQEGARVALCGRNEAALQEATTAVAAVGGAAPTGIRADLSQAADVERFVEEGVSALGRLDAVFINAGGPPAGQPLEFSDAQWEGAVQTNLMSAVRLIRAAVPHLRRAGGGSVVALASWSVKEPIPDLLLSNSVRLAVVGLMKTMAQELGPHQIRFNVVCPGRILTERARDIDRRRAEREKRTPEEVAAANAAIIPLRRYGTPAEIANLIVFLCSPAAAYITGTTIPVDGGIVRAVM